jgi:hypothetical protein
MATAITTAAERGSRHRAVADTGGFDFHPVFLDWLISPNPFHPVILLLLFESMPL